MMTYSEFKPGDGRMIAYHQQPGTGPGIVFMGGFRSDMAGTKAMWLQDWATAHGRAFLRFDYTGHGQSSGHFADGCIGDWARDARDVISHLTRGPQIIIGSSMGGWIALLVARALPERLAALVGIAAAPDFTEDSMWAGFDLSQRAEVTEIGHIDWPSDYDNGTYPITRRLIEEGRSNLVLRSPLHLTAPVRLLQGSADRDVLPAVALRLFNHMTGPDIRLTIVKNADHRFSTPENLAHLGAVLDSL